MNKQEKQLFPIYREAQNYVPTPTANQGLVYQKWVQSWFRPSEHQIELDKTVFLKQWNKRVGESELLRSYQQRMEKLIQQKKGTTMKLKNIDPFVTGMGLPHPVENGMIWHHNLGVPYIPGSSIKGMLRSWVETWEQVEQGTIDHVFGKQELSHQVGEYLFFDAIPMKPVQLRVDIMTPHFQDYYSEMEKNSSERKTYPNERSQPNPIPFLTVAHGQEFLFAIAPRKQDNQSTLKKVKTWLEQALVTIGIGAKTTVGYGRFQK